MDLKSKMELITQGTLEVITENELEDKLQKEQPVAYIGYEPSGKVHLGHTITVLKMIDLQKAGFKVKILLADYHAFLNGKGSLEEIKEVAEYNKKCFLALGLSPETEFILGSSFQTKEEYTTQVYQLALLTTLVRAKRSMAQITRDAEDHKVAEVIYPLMQVVDMVFLETDLAMGGMEQRKIHMLARENLPRIGKAAPVCLHTPLLHGTDGSEKMSSSKGNFIAIDDSPEDIKKKMKKGYCPAGEVEGNPVIEMAQHFVFPFTEKLVIKRPEKFGGNLELDYSELIEMYSREKLHPLDLKNAITDYLIEFLKPVREYMEINAKN